MITELDRYKKPTSALITKPQHGGSWIELSSAALDHNIATYRTLAPTNLQLAAIVKGNAYGHGMIPVAQYLNKHPSIDWLCTASVSEALIIRAHNIKKSLAVLSYHDAPLAQAIAQDIDLVVYDLVSAQAVSAAALEVRKTAYVHIKLDTGLSRLGIRVEPHTVEETVILFKHIAQLPGIQVRALFSHFADVESDDHVFVTHQKGLFDQVAAQFDQMMRHFSCTAALGTIPLEKYHIARFGIGLYGLWPSAENREAILRYGLSLLPVMSWKTRIIQVKQIPAGSSVGYDRTHTTLQSTTIAILPIGYADGLDRKLSNRGHVVIQGIAAPIIGRISMNVAIVDVTEIPQAQAGDEVLVMGSHTMVHPDALARHIGTINYEVVTRISPYISRQIVP